MCSASYSATLAELGRFPLSLEIIKNMVKYYWRLEGMGQTDMLRLKKIVNFIKKEINCTNLITDFTDKCQMSAPVTKTYDNIL